MRVRVAAPFEIPGLDGDGWLEAPEGCCVRDLLKGVGGLPARILPVFVNGKQVKKSHRLLDGDTVVFLYPLSGG